MKFLKADWIITCDNDFTVIKDGGIIFNEKIVDVGQSKELEEKYNNLIPNYLGKNSCIMPGLINPHIHLEFSANKTTLKYGNFNEWLNSVITNRDELIQKADTSLINLTLEKILRAGTTTIGAISSYGFDLKACSNASLNVVYFNEVIGSKADMVDTLFDDFRARLKNSKEYESNSFIPAIAIHSPYSVHPFLIREVLNIAKNEKLAVSAHFLESPAERQWLDESKGEFVDFFLNFLNQKSALTTTLEFLKQFKDVNNLSFVHCVEANKEELKEIKELNASIIHCPNSNRLLNNTILDLNNLNGINLAIGTDGLSSNTSLSLFNELQNALFMHTEEPLAELSSKLLASATRGGAKALGLNKGELAAGKDADIISFNLADCVQNSEDLATYVLLHKKNIDNIIIGGKKC